jgi:hypothetical protein
MNSERRKKYTISAPQTPYARTQEGVRPFAMQKDFIQGHVAPAALHRDQAAEARPEQAGRDRTVKREQRPCLADALGPMVPTIR